MNMIRHQAIHWAKQPFASSRMEHQFPKSRMEGISQPAFPAIKRCHRPVNDGIALIVFFRQPRQVIRMGLCRSRRKEAFIFFSGHAESKPPYVRSYKRKLKM